MPHRCVRSHSRPGALVAPTCAASLVFRVLHIDNHILTNASEGPCNASSSLTLKGALARRRSRSTSRRTSPGVATTRCSSIAIRKVGHALAAQAQGCRSRSINGIATFERDSRTTRELADARAGRHAENRRRQPRGGRGARHARAHARCEQGHRAGAALGHRHPRRVALHRRPAAGGQDQARREPHRRDRQPRAQEHADVPVADALPGKARDPDRSRPSATRRTTCAPPNRASASTK